MAEEWRVRGAAWMQLPWMGMVLALGYGLGGELLFKQMIDSDILVGTLSISFLFLLPFAIGVLTLVLSPKASRMSWGYATFAPWAVCTALGILVIIFALEAWVCVAMGLPIFFVMSSLGGALVCWRVNRRAAIERGEKERNNPMFGAILLVPLLFSPIEALWQPPTVVREVERVVVVNAPAEVIWEEFVTVPKIQPEEERFAWFRAAGLPHPVEATLVNPGAEGVRYASYDNGMKVIEPVQIWSLHEQYRFGVVIDPDGGQHLPLWSDVAGEHLQVQWVEYRVEPLSDQQVRLHLTSRYALQTPMNGYSVMWVDFLLGDFQQYILDIVVARAESKI